MNAIIKISVIKATVQISVIKAIVKISVTKAIVKISVIKAIIISAFESGWYTGGRVAGNSLDSTMVRRKLG